MPIILAVVSQKGGVSKTTIVAHLAVGLSRAPFNRKVLAVDCDPQGSLTNHLGYDKKVIQGLPEFLKGENTNPIRYSSTMDIFPCNRSLVFIEKFSLEPLRTFVKDKDYDIILLDTAPSFSDFLIQPLLISTHYLVPLPTKGGSLCLQSIIDLQEVANFLCEKANPNLSFLGVVLTQVMKTKVSNSVIRYLKEHQIKTIPVSIRHTTKIVEAADQGTTVFDSAPKSGVCKDFQGLSKYIDKILAEKSQATGETQEKKNKRTKKVRK